MFKPLVIKDLVAQVPIIQGGMGIGISLHRLAGTVAKEGGIGLLSTAQIGYQRDDFEKSPLRSNWEAAKEQFEKAKEIAQGGIVGFNIMVAQFNYDKIVRRCAEIGADVIVSGAGLPVNLPELVEGTKTKIAPIVSSAKGAKVLLKTWAKRYNRTADFVVIEGPKAGGHLGFKPEDIETMMIQENMDKEVTEIVKIVKQYADQYDENVPVVFAGGVFDKGDIQHYLDLGCSGVQMATRFVVTEECDAPEDFKKRYLNAEEKDIRILKSPVGMPGRAINNTFLETSKVEQIPIETCRDCLALKHCDRTTIPYCISEALLNSVRGNTENGLLFCGANVFRVKAKTTVKSLIDELTGRLEPV